MGLNPFKAVKKFVKKAVKTTIKIAKTVISWIAPKPDIPDFGDSEFDDFEKGILLNKQSNDASIPVIYGTRMIGGVRCFMESSGADNASLYMALVLCEGEINDITSIKIDDKTVTWSGDLADNSQVTVNTSDGNFYKDSASLITVEPHYGTDAQSASSLLSTLSSWGSNHKLSGLAYLALKFTWNQDAFQGVPKVQAVVQGKKVVSYDVSSVAQTAAHSDNPAWCLLDYLTNARYGKGLAIGDINIPSFYTASGVCDTNVTPYTGASAIDIMDCNAILDTSKKVMENVREVITGCRGYLTFTGGEYKLLIETTGSANITLTEDDIIGGYNLSSEDKNSKYNRVIVSFVNPDRNWQVDEVQWPEVDDSGYAAADQHATMKAADGGFLLEGRFDMKALTSPYQALEMAEVICRRSRDALKLDIICGGDAYDLAVGDIVAITHSSIGFSSKDMRVVGFTFNEDYTIGLSLIEHQNAHYTWATKTQAATTPSTTLPDPFSVVAPASVTLTDELIEYADGVVLTRLNIAITASTDQFVQYYQVETKQSTETNYKIVAKGTELNHEMLNVVDGKIYNVRVKAINALGVSSTYTSENRTIVGGSDPPSDVDDFAIEMHGSNQMRLTWTPPSSDTDLDIAYYEIRYQDVTSGAVWNTSTNLIRVTRRKSDNALVNSRVGAFLIKAIDKTGNESNNESIIYTNVSNVFAYTDISTTTENPNLFLSPAQMDATYPLCVKEDTSGDVVLSLDTITNFEDTVGDFDTPSGDFELGGTDATSNPTYYLANRDSLGYYDFINSISLSATYDGTVKPTLTLDFENPYDLFDSGRGYLYFDDAKAPFDGSEPSHAFHKLQIATSTTSLGAATVYNDISSSATYAFRYAKFRLRLTNDDNKTSSNVTQLVIKLAMENRNAKGNDIASGATTKVITFSNAFFATPSLGIATQNLSSGDYFTISSKSATGFSITFYNSSAVVQDRTFDYVAEGYGLSP